MKRRASVTVKGRRERPTTVTPTRAAPDSPIKPAICYLLVRGVNIFITIPFFFAFFPQLPSFFNKQSSAPAITPSEATLAFQYELPGFNYFSQALDCNRNVE